MPGNIVKKNITDIVDILALKQKNHQNIMLFSDSGAGEFFRSKVHSLLSKFLESITISEHDIYLAKFIKRCLFDSIISTNIDSILEKALEYVEMKELFDFVVHIPEDMPVKADRMPARMVIKVFGDIYPRDYNGRVSTDEPQGRRTHAT